MVKIEVDRKLWRTPLTDIRARQIGLVTKKHHEYFIAYLHRIDGMKLGLSVKVILCKTYQFHCDKIYQLRNKIILTVSPVKLVN